MKNVKHRVVATILTMCMSLVMTDSSFAYALGRNNANSNIFFNETTTVDNDNSEFEIQNGVLVKYNGTSEEVTIPSNVTTIGVGAFSNNTTMNFLYIPSNVITIEERAFYGCTNLETVYAEDGLQVVGDWAFYNCSLLRACALPETTTKIGKLAFYGCENLTGVSLGVLVEEIGEKALSIESSPELMIEGTSGSYAAKYAKNNNIPFQEKVLEDEFEAGSKKINAKANKHGFTFNQKQFKKVKWFIKPYIVKDDGGNEVGTCIIEVGHLRYKNPIKTTKKKYQNYLIYRVTMSPNQTPFTLKCKWYKTRNGRQLGKDSAFGKQVVTYGKGITGYAKQVSVSCTLPNGLSLQDWQPKNSPKTDTTQIGLTAASTKETSIGATWEIVHKQLKSVSNTSRTKRRFSETFKYSLPITGDDSYFCGDSMHYGIAMFYSGTSSKEKKYTLTLTLKAKFGTAKKNLYGLNKYSMLTRTGVDFSKTVKAKSKKIKLTIK